MSVPFLDLKAQYASIKREIDPAIHAVIETCSFAGGPAVEAFEKAYAAYCGTKHCIAVGNGTSAIELILRGLGIGIHDEVITATNSFFASAEAISNAGATPVLVDCNENDALIDIHAVERAITPRTKAILPVHLYGQCAEMDVLRALAKRHTLFLIEDACQAHGSTYKGKKAGNLAHAAAFSFYPGKNLGAYGEGGAITTNDDVLATTLRMLREHGMPEKYVHALIGRNERMDGIQGAVLGVKLPHLDTWNIARKRHAAQYRSLLSHDKRLQFFDTHPDRDTNYHLFVVRVPQRDTVQAKLKEKSIATGIHYPIPIHQQKAYGTQWSKGDFPVSETLADQILSLPMYPELTEKMIHEVCDALLAAL